MKMAISNVGGEKDMNLGVFFKGKAKKGTLMTGYGGQVRNRFKDGVEVTGRYVLLLPNTKPQKVLDAQYLADEIKIKEYELKKVCKKLD